MLCNFCSLKIIIDDYRDSFCVDCRPIGRGMGPAVAWQIKAHNSYVKRNLGAYIVRTFIRDPNQPMRRNNQGHSPMSWNRDYNASRAMLLKGLDLVAGRLLPHNHLHTTHKFPERQRFARVL